MCDVGNCPKHSGSESLPLLRHCRDPMDWLLSPRNIKISNKQNRSRLRYRSNYYLRSVVFRNFSVIHRHFHGNYLLKSKSSTRILVKYASLKLSSI